MMNKLFLSGMMRSGTTLLQMAINAHPDSRVEYQTKTNDLIGLKKQFLDEINSREYHVLKHYNPTSTYKYNDFLIWLNNCLENELINLDALFHEGSEEKVSVVGFKEVLMEEYYPPFMNNNIKCLNIIRDPRDVISSMSFGRGEKHTGSRRPVLFDLRNWRKSVHFSHFLQDKENFKFILFEELLSDPEKVMNDIYKWLGLKEISIEKIEDNIKLKGWTDNSSFERRKLFDPKASGGFRTNLPEKVLEYIEVVCMPEMLALGYETNVNSNQFEQFISNYSDPFVIERNEFDQGYSSSESNVTYEISRMKKDYISLIKETLND